MRLSGRAHRGQRGAAHRSHVFARTMSCFCSDPQRQSRSTETKITEDFKTLRRYLKTEEANMLAALKREESQKIQVIQVIQVISETSRDASSLSDSVKKMEELATGAAFLTVSVRLKEAPRPPTNESRCCLFLSSQIEEAKYVKNLQLRVLKKLLRISKNSKLGRIPSRTPQISIDVLSPAAPAVSGGPAAPPRPQLAAVHPEVMLTVTCRYPPGPPPPRLGAEDNPPKRHGSSRLTPG